MDFIAIQEFPVTLMTTMDPDNNIAHLHTCLSHKIYCIFTEDTHSTIINELSSDKDEENEVKLDNHNHWSQHIVTSPHALLHDSSMIVNPPTSLVIHSNPLQRGTSLATMMMLPSTICEQECSPSTRCHNGMFVGGGSIVEEVYKLATSGSSMFELDLQRPMVPAIAVKFWGLLEHAAHKTDFTEVLSPHRSFLMLVSTSYYYPMYHWQMLLI